MNRVVFRLAAVLAAHLLCAPALASPVPETWSRPFPDLAGHSETYDEATRRLEKGDEAAAHRVWGQIAEDGCETDVQRAARLHIAAFEARRLRFGPAARAIECVARTDDHPSRKDVIWQAATFARLAGHPDRASKLYGLFWENTWSDPRAGEAAERALRGAAEMGWRGSMSTAWGWWLEEQGVPLRAPVLAVELAGLRATALERDHPEEADEVREGVRALVREADEGPQLRAALLRLRYGELLPDLQRLETFRFPVYDPWPPCPEPEPVPVVDADRAEALEEEVASEGLLAVLGTTGSSLREDRPWPEEWDEAVDELRALTEALDLALAELVEAAEEPADRATFLLQRARIQDLRGRVWTSAEMAEPGDCHLCTWGHGDMSGLLRHPEVLDSEERARELLGSLLGWAAEVGYEGPELAEASRMAWVRPLDEGWFAEGRRLLPPLCTDRAPWPPTPAPDRLRRAYAALERTPDQLDDRLEVADALAELGHEARAEALLDWLAIDSPALVQDGRLACAKARLAARSGDWTSAERHLQRAREGRPADPGLLAGQALLQLRRREAGEALPLVTAALAERPEDPVLLQLKALTLEGLGLEGEAERELRRLLEAGPDPGEAALQLAVLGLRFPGSDDPLRTMRLGQAIGFRTDPGPQAELLWPLWRRLARRQDRARRAEARNRGEAGVESVPLHPALGARTWRSATDPALEQLAALRADLAELNDAWLEGAWAFEERLAQAPVLDRRAERLEEELEPLVAADQPPRIRFEALALRAEVRRLGAAWWWDLAMVCTPPDCGTFLEEKGWERRPECDELEPLAEERLETSLAAWRGLAEEAEREPWYGPPVEEALRELSRLDPNVRVPRLDRLVPAVCRNRPARSSPEESIRDALTRPDSSALESGLDLARGWIEQGRPEEALGVLRGLETHVSSGDPRVACAEGVALLELGDRVQAREALERARTGRRRDPAIPLALAIAALRDRDPATAATELGRIPRRVRTDRVRLARAALARTQGEHATARSELEALIGERGPLTAAALENLGALLLKDLRDYQGAKLAFEEVPFWRGDVLRELDWQHPLRLGYQEADKRLRKQRRLEERERRRGQ